MRKVTPALLLLAAAALGCTAPPPVHDAEIRTVRAGSPPGFLTLGANDRLRVDVLLHPELSSSLDGVRVDPQGKLFLPLVGGVVVTGKTLAEVNADLAVAYGRYIQEPSVTATLLEYGSKDFHVLGNVATPGRKTMDRPYNALEALAQGGAFTRGADRKSVFLLRPHGETMEVHRFDSATPGPEGLVAIWPGDVIFVRQKGTEDFQEALLPILSGLGFSTIHSIDLLSN